MYTACLQDQVQLDYLLKQLRWDKSVAKYFLVTLDSVQMSLGFTRLILEYTQDPITYVESGYILHLCNRLSAHGASLWIEDAWSPELQCVGDESIIEHFISIQHITRAELCRANAVRLYLQVVTIADLADLMGTFVPSGMLTGDWQAGSDLKWPYQPLLPPSFWSSFRCCLRRSFCSRMPPMTWAHHSMNLNIPLGRWKLVRRNTWFSAYASESTIFWRREDDEVLHVMTRSKVDRLFDFSHTTMLLPLASHPIRVRQLDDLLWQLQEYRPVLFDVTSVTPGQLISFSGSVNSHK